MQFGNSAACATAGEKSDFDGEARGWRSFGVVRRDAPSAILILCDHATNALPPEYGSLGLPEWRLDRHIAYDIGALPVALELGRHLNATVVYSRFSRLLIDPNRGRDDPTLIMQLSDGAVIPGNARLDEPEISKRIERFYAPYDDAVSTEIAFMKEHGVTPCLISLHSFTESWRDAPRKWHAGILWDKDPRMAMPLLHELRARTSFEIGDNEPYSGQLRGDMLHRHATVAGLPHALIEVRQDLIRDEAGQMAWASLLAECIASLFANKTMEADLSRVEYFGSHTDIEASDRNGC